MTPSLPRSVLSSADESIRLLAGLLRAWGLDPNDFEFEGGERCALCEGFGLVGGVVLVRRRSTGEERLYVAAPDSAWFGTLMMDVGRGHFAPARERSKVATALQQVA